ncbi:MAG: hypothetical protein AAGF77_11895 [Bacteroidota bacterium]
MEDNKLEQLFEQLEGKFDLEEPQVGHQERFLQKLAQSQQGVVAINRKRNLWKPLFIAASIALLCSLGFQFLNREPSIKEQVVEIAPEVSETEFYFKGLIEQQVRQLQEEKSPENAKLVDDTLRKLDELQSDYAQLERELVKGGNNKIILSAMITNFQTRIALLKEVLYNVENIKKLKREDDANFTTEI